MIFEIAVAIILAVIVLSNLEFFGGLLFGLLALVVLIAIGIAIIAIVGVGLNTVDIDFGELIIYAILAIPVFGLLSGLFIFIGWIRKRLKKFYDFKTILKFLSIKLFTPGFTDTQKIDKIKKINSLVNYGRKQYQLLDKRKKQAEIEKYDGYFLKCKNDFDALTDLINKEMSEYLNQDYINIRLFDPTREDIYGKIEINTKKNKSIIKISISKDNFKVRDYSFARNESGEHIEFSSTRVKPTVKVAKKYLLSYFKLHPHLLEE